MTTALLSDLSPAELDEQIFPLWAERWTQAERVRSYRRTLAKAIWPTEFEERIGRYEDRRSKTHRISKFDISTYQASLAKAEAALAEVEAALAPLEAEYASRPWSRYVLVGGGHLHRWHGCSSLRPATQTFLLAESSGLTDAEVVAHYSYTACTKCFPDAPVAVAPKLDTSIYCAGSGTYDGEDVNGSKRLYRPWARCQVCGAGTSISSLGKLRKHKATDKENV